MWLLVIIALSFDPPYKVRGSISIPYETQSQCLAEMNRIVPQMDFAKTRITYSCTFRGYLAP